MRRRSTSTTARSGEQGIAVDVIDADVDLTPYQLAIAPMLYMVRDGFAGRAEAFVANGGHR